MEKYSHLEKPSMKSHLSLEWVTFMRTEVVGNGLNTYSIEGTGFTLYEKGTYIQTSYKQFLIKMLIII